ncbi:MAG: hypothetical protein HIU83_15130 [Proteobacteria bacterium]|nr:hypothetical protein [Pseudomonadota bacterium]
MASGLLGKAALTAATNTSIYTVPAATVATVNVNMVNTSAASIAVRLSIGTAVPATADYIEYDTIIPANGVLERSGLVMSTAEVLVARAEAAGISIRVYGFEEVA